MPTRVLPFVASCLFCAGAAAETGYVTDMLRLGLHEASDTSDEPIENLTSGTALEVLERTSLYLRVRTEQGREGWVKAAYVVGEKPARARVAELEAETAVLREALEQANAARTEAEGTASRLGARAEAREDSRDAVGETLARLRRENEDLEGRLERYRDSVPRLWAGAALVVALVGGFLLGVWWLAALIRRRHGGFRIY
jgi:SH3 domain protein